jgi:hypothetical protein
MPRGSRPGERRGGRQPGTPNKKTLLKLAGIDAAGDEASPLVFLLRLMRDCDVPVAERLNAAAEAAQYVHTRPKAASDQDSVVCVVEAGPHGFGWGAVEQFMKVLRKAEPEAHPNPAEGDDLQKLLPLEFMLRVMRDPKVPPQIRFRAVKLAARYTHAKQAAVADDLPDGEKRAILDNRHNFEIPAEAAVRFRDARPRFEDMGPESGAAWVYAFRNNSVAELGLEAARDLELPDGYGYQDFQTDDGMLRDISAKRRKQPLSAQEQFAEAHLLARKFTYQRCRDRARSRVEELDNQLQERPDGQMQKEMNELDKRFPEDKEFFGYAAMQTIKAYLKKAAGGKN